MEERLKIKISDVYKVLKAIDLLKGLQLFDEDVIDHEINVSDQMFVDSIAKFNDHTNDLVSAFEKEDMKLIRDSLINLRVESMNIASDFDNFKDDIGELIKAL